MARNKKNAVEFYVVSWADYDPNEERMSSGTLTDIFSTLEGARESVMEQILCMAKDAIDNYGKKECRKLFGTSDINKLAKKSITCDQSDYIVSVNPDTDTESQYTITKYSTEFVK